MVGLITSCAKLLYAIIRYSFQYLSAGPHFINAPYSAGYPRLAILGIIKVSVSS